MNSHKKLMLLALSIFNMHFYTKADQNQHRFSRETIELSLLVQQIEGNPELQQAFTDLSKIISKSDITDADIINFTPQYAACRYLILQSIQDFDELTAQQAAQEKAQNDEPKKNQSTNNFGSWVKNFANEKERNKRFKHQEMSRIQQERQARKNSQQ